LFGHNSTSIYIETVKLPFIENYVKDSFFYVGKVSNVPEELAKWVEDECGVVLFATKRKIIIGAPTPPPLPLLYNCNSKMEKSTLWINK
jgi:hypothetical protein